MKERGILFSAPEVRALLAGTKTQKRWIYKGHSPTFCPSAAGGCWGIPVGERQKCPYGQPGDLLWVRETFGYFDPDGTGEDYESDLNDDGKDGPCKAYTPELMQEGHALRDCWRRRIAYRASWQDGKYGSGVEGPGRWRPSIHMPRWASRITLEITDVRVERLQDISEADAMAEGAPPSHTSIDRISREFGYADFPRSWYAQLWESINGPGSWDAKPWVWVLSFKRT